MQVQIKRRRWDLPEAAEINIAWEEIDTIICWSNMIQSPLKVDELEITLVNEFLPIFANPTKKNTKGNSS